MPNYIFLFGSYFPLVWTSSNARLKITDGATGVLADWAKYRFRPPVAFTYHLRDNIGWGFILPVAQVLPSCEETYDSVMAIIREAKFINAL